jgi:hypothetical protein
MNNYSLDDEELDLIPLDDEFFPTDEEEELDIIPLDYEDQEFEFNRPEEINVDFPEEQQNQINGEEHIQENVNPEDESKKEEEFKFPVYLDESDRIDAEIDRNKAQFISRMGESVLGLPGDIYNFLSSFIPSELLGIAGQYLPTSEKLRETSESASLGYTAPKNEEEERIGEVFSDIGSFLTPGAKQYSLARNIGIPVFANLVKEGVDKVGLGEFSDEAKMGTMVALDIMHLRNGGPKAYSGKLFNLSEQLVPSGAKYSNPRFFSSLKNLFQDMKKGGTTPSKSSSLRKIREILKKGKDGSINVEELIEFRKSLNELLDKAKAFSLETPTKIRKKQIKNLNKVKNKVIKAIDDYGKTNPKFAEVNKAANESWAALESSQVISNFLQKMAGSIVKNSAVQTVLGLGSIVGSKVAGIGAYLAPAAIIYQGIKILYQIGKSPTLRRYYTNIMKGALSGNTSQVLKNTKALDLALEEEED